MPEPGVQVGGPVSLALAKPPLVAVANAKPAGVEQVASASDMFLAVACAEQRASDVAAAALLFLAVAFATPPPAVATALAALAPVAMAVPVEAPSPSALAALAPSAVALPEPPLSPVALAALPLVATEVAEPPVAVDAASLTPDAVAFAFPVVITSASQVLPSVPVFGTSPEVDTHLTALAALAVPVVSEKSRAHTSAKSAKLREWIIGICPPRNCDFRTRCGLGVEILYRSRRTIARGTRRRSTLSRGYLIASALGGERAS